MAAHRKSASFGGAIKSKNGGPRNLKNHPYMFHHLADSINVSLNTGLQGELPLTRELFAVKILEYPSTAKTMDPAGGPASSNSWQKQFIRGFDEGNLQTGQTRCGRRLHKAGQHVGDGAFRMGARRYVLRPSWSHSLEEGDGQKRWDLGMEGTFRVDQRNQKGNVGRSGFKDSSLAGENFLRDYTQNLSDDEFSLQHWMSFKCIRNDASVSEHWDHKYPTDARRLVRGDKLTRPRIIPSHSRDVIELTNEGCRKSMTKYINKVKMSEPHKKQSLFQGGSQVQSSFSVHPTQRSGIAEAVKETWRTPTRLSSTSQRILRGVPQGVEQSFDGELAVLKLPGNGCRKPCLRAYRKNQRKTLPDSLRNSSTRGLSDSSRRKCGPSTKQCIPETPRMKNAEAVLLPTEQLASSEENGTCCVDTSEKGASGKLASDRQTAGRELRNMNCKVQEEDGITTSSPSEGEMAASIERSRSLSEKYRPKMLKDLLGQNLVVNALSNAISRDKVAPVYLFQGSHGTGKTSAARIFAAALNCVTSGDKKPCGCCSECTALVSGKTSGIWELDAASHNGIGHLKELIQGTVSASSGSRYKIVIIDECHIFSHETWNALMRLLEEPPGNTVIILITTDPDKLPLTVVSRCQKFHFLQIKHLDIVNRLDTVTKLENLDAEPGALNLIASKSEGSLRDAEIVLEQASLLGQRITLATIHQLVGSVPDDKLLSLLDSALCSDTVNTVRRTRDLIDSGVEPLDLMSQLATLITDILAGSYVSMYTNRNEGCSSMYALSDSEMESLRTSLRILSEAEKQVRAVYQYRTTWLTAALLQFGRSVPSKSESLDLSKNIIASPATQPIAKNAKTNKQKSLSIGREGRKQRAGTASEGEIHGSKDFGTKKSTRSGIKAQASFNGGIDLHFKFPSDLGSLWLDVLTCCSPLSLRQLLESHGKLLAVSFSAVNTVAHLLFEKPDHKLKAEMYKMSITNSFSKVLGVSVEVKISLGQVSCNEGFKSSPAAADNEPVRQSPSELCVGCEDEEPQGGKGIRESKFAVQLTSKDFNLTSCLPAIFSQPQPSASNLLVWKGFARPSCGAEAAMPEEHSSKNASIHDSKSCAPMQNLRGSTKLQNETSKHRRRRRNFFWRPTARLHGQKHSRDCAFASFKEDNSTQAYNLEEESLILVHQRKCGRLLCWKSQKAKETRHHR